MAQVRSNQVCPWGTCEPKLGKERYFFLCWLVLPELQVLHVTKPVYTGENEVLVQHLSV